MWATGPPKLVSPSTRNARSTSSAARGLVTQGRLTESISVFKGSNAHYRKGKTCKLSRNAVTSA